MGRKRSHQGRGEGRREEERTRGTRVEGNRERHTHKYRDRKT